MDFEPDYYSIAEAAEALGTTEQNIYRAAEAGEVQLVFFPNDAADGIYRVYEVTIQDGVDGPLYSILSGHYPLFSPHAGRLMRNGSTVVNSFFDEQGIPRHFLDEETLEPAPVTASNAFIEAKELNRLQTITQNVQESTDSIEEIKFRDMPKNGDDWCRIIYAYHTSFPTFTRKEVWSKFRKGCTVEAKGTTFEIDSANDEKKKRFIQVIGEDTYKLEKKSFDDRWRRYETKK